MHFEDFGSFLFMGGYGFYVWLSFGVTALSLLVLWLDSYFLKRTLLKKIISEQKRQARIKAASEQSAAATQKTSGETL